MFGDVHLRIGVKKINGDWFVGELLPDGGDLMGLEDKAPNMLLLHLEPYMNENNEPTGMYRMVYCVKAKSNQPTHLREAASVYIGEIANMHNVGTY